jgi:transcriptional regulator with XRE-family HTH domain
LIAELRRAVSESGLSHNEIARRTGISQPQITRFANGQRLLTLETADKLFAALGLTLAHLAAPAERQPPAPKRTRKPKGE